MNPALPKIRKLSIAKKSWEIRPLPKNTHKPGEERRSGVNPALPKQNWYYVYLLKSEKTPYIYIGCTSNLGERLKRHKEGKVYSTKKMLPVELMYCEAYRVKECAYKREQALKKYGSGLAKLKQRLKIKGRAG